MGWCLRRRPFWQFERRSAAMQAAGTDGRCSEGRLAGCGRRAGLEEGPVGVCVEVQRVVVYGMRSTQAVAVA